MSDLKQNLLAGDVPQSRSTRSHLFFVCKILLCVIVLLALTAVPIFLMYWMTATCPWDSYLYFNYDTNEYDCMAAKSDEERRENEKFNMLKLSVGTVLTVFVVGFMLSCVLLASWKSCSRLPKKSTSGNHENKVTPIYAPKTSELQHILIVD